MKPQFIPAIISGGSGTRLWPVSRRSFPKQFAEIFGDGLGNSLFARAASRVMPLGLPWTITIEDLRTLTEKALIVEGFTREQALRQTLYEPCGRNTAPAIAFLCRALELNGAQDAVVGVFPADQLIEDEDQFRETVLRAVEFAAAGEIVTLGITPTFPATGYGYIETSGPAVADTIVGATTARRAVRFREKPSESKAQEFIAQGGYYWNAGMFVFKVSRMIELLKLHAPKVWDPFTELKSDYSNIATVYDRVESISIDYAVMEKLDSHVTIPCVFDWNDVGSWDAIADIKEGRHFPTAPTGIAAGLTAGIAAGLNASAATAAIEIESQNCFVSPTDQKTYAFVGVSDLVVIDTQDATLILKRGQSEKVKEVVDRLKSFPPLAARRATEHAFEIRPWGKFEVLKDTPDFKSKVITIDPGAQISYQSHSKRAEHWTIVKGQGDVILNDEVIPVEPGMHVFIPLKAKHRIRNTGKEPLTFVEVQLGTYFGEDDIVRFDDSYGRR